MDVFLIHDDLIPFHFESLGKLLSSWKRNIASRCGWMSEWPPEAPQYPRAVRGTRLSTILMAISGCMKTTLLYQIFRPPLDRCFFRPAFPRSSAPPHFHWRLWCLDPPGDGQERGMLRGVEGLLIHGWLSDLRLCWSRHHPVDRRVEIKNRGPKTDPWDAPQGVLLARNNTCLVWAKKRKWSMQWSDQRCNDIRFRWKGSTYFWTYDI